MSLNQLEFALRTLALIVSAYPYCARESHAMSCIKCAVQYCAKEMQMKSVEIRPLFSRIYFEKSTNFRDRFRWTLPKKLANFVDYSQ